MNNDQNNRGDINESANGEWTSTPEEQITGADEPVTGSSVPGSNAGDPVAGSADYASAGGTKVGEEESAETFGNEAGQYRSTPHEVHYMNNSRYYSQHEVNEPEKTPKKKKSKKNTRKAATGWRRAGMLVASAILFGVFAGGAFLGVAYLGGTLDQSSNNVSVSQSSGNGEVEVKASSTSNNSGAVVTDVTEVVEAAMPSVVAITNTTVSEVHGFFGGSEELESSSSGSGIIVGQSDTELLIATNEHVIEDASTLSVCFIDNTVVEAKVKGSDRANDLAVIVVKLSDIEASTLEEITIATRGDSDSLNVGEPVIAIGNALGYGQSVTTGVLSAKEVEIEDLDGNYIQTDAAINPGNSGGALLNINGELIGINAAKVSGSGVEGMGYAIPISVATPILDELMTQETKEKVAESERGYLGIACLDVTSDVAEAYDMPMGVRISEAYDGGAALEAGLQKGDIITKLDKTTIDSYDILSSTLEYYRKGDEVTLTVARMGTEGEYEEMEVQVTLGAKIE